MDYSRKDINTFEKAVESLKQYRRYELVDEKNKDLLNSLYVDPLDNDAILNLCLRDNTTVLIGRKGTGKSTILMRMQNELRESSEIITCYIDVKNIYDRAKQNHTTISYLEGASKSENETYSIQRKFVCDFIEELVKELESKHDSIWKKIAKPVKFNKSNKSIDRLIAIKDRILNNDHLEKIELQTIDEVYNETSRDLSYEDETSMSIRGQSKSEGPLRKNSIEAELSNNYSVGEHRGNKKKYNRIFARIFEITTIIEEIKNVLKELNYKRLFIVLDDYSEIDQTALQLFCDLIVNSLNNNSDNFIKFKISAYPGRVELGELDRQKIDIRYLDYYQLYNFDNRDGMEESAIDYTKRIVNKRLAVFTDNDFDYYFDVKDSGPEPFYELLFQMTLNVVRHLGLILDYAKDISIYRKRKITLNDLKEASIKFYTERLSVFFKESGSAMMTYDERIHRLQLREFLDDIVNKSKDVKTKIRTNIYSAKIFSKERSNPYCSHFSILPEYEELVASLELNFFISKYNEMSNKSGKKVAIYSLNYGLATFENIKWGKPKENSARTYYIESPFNYNKVVENFIKNSERIRCKNPKCNYVYEMSNLKFLQEHGMNCIECGSQNSVEVERIYNEYDDKVKEIEEKENLLEIDQYRFMYETYLNGGIVTSNQMAQELDTSRQKIAWLTKKLEEDFSFIRKDRSQSPVKYILTDEGSEYIRIEE